jgi:ankyrin repeat protein
MTLWRPKTMRAFPLLLLLLLVAIAVITRAQQDVFEVDPDQESLSTNNHAPGNDLLTETEQYREVALDDDHALLQSAAHGDIDRVLQILHDDPNAVDVENSMGWSPIIFATANQLLDMVRTVSRYFSPVVSVCLFLSLSLAFSLISNVYFGKWWL